MQKVHRSKLCPFCQHAVSRHGVGGCMVRLGIVVPQKNNQKNFCGCMIGVQDLQLKEKLKV